MGSELKGLKFHTKALAISALTGISEEREEFCIFNRDGDGFICENELKNALRNLEVNPSDVDVKQIVDCAEVDGDGNLSKSEFIKLVCQLEDFGNDIEVQNSIRAFDKAKKDFVSIGELKNEDIEQVKNEGKDGKGNILNLTKHVKKKQRFTKNTGDECTKYEAFVTVSIQAKPKTKTGCKLQESDLERMSEIEEWKKRWRRNAAMRNSSKIFPKTWWMLLAKLDIRLYEKDTINLKLTTYYWLNE